MRSAFLDTLLQEAEIDKELTLITADLGYGVFESFEEKYPCQYINVGVAEQAMTGIAAGMALEGKRLITYSIGNFPTLRCLEQIRNDACYHNLNITVVASGGGFSYGQLGMSHHATEDLAIMRALPGVDVCAPCTSYEASLIFGQLIKRNSVSYLRLDKSVAHENSDPADFVFGKMRKFKDGDDITLIAIGGILEQVLLAARSLEQHGVSARVMACHSLKPFDRDSVIDAAVNTGGIVTIEEHNLIGGLSSAVADVCLESGVLPKLFDKVGLNDIYSSVVGDQQYLRRYYGMDSNAIFQKVIKVVKESK